MSGDWVVNWRIGTINGYSYVHPHKSRYSWNLNFLNKSAFHPHKTSEFATRNGILFKQLPRVVYEPIHTNPVKQICGFKNVWIREDETLVNYFSEMWIIGVIVMFDTFFLSAGWILNLSSIIFGWNTWLCTCVCSNICKKVASAFVCSY